MGSYIISSYWKSALKFAQGTNQMHYHRWKILFLKGVHEDQRKNQPEKVFIDIF